MFSCDRAGVFSSIDTPVHTAKTGDGIFIANYARARRRLPRPSGHEEVTRSAVTRPGGVETRKSSAGNQFGPLIFFSGP
jgi:hypothetical protein